MKRLLKFIVVCFLFIVAIGMALSIYCQGVNPNENGWLPFFGLAFPYLLWINVFCVFVLFIRKKVALIIPLVALVYGWSSIWNYYSLFAKTEFSSADIEEISLISYNVRIFDVNENIGGNARDSIFSALQRKTPNIICFQEFYYVETPGQFDTKSVLENELGLTNHSENYTHHMRGGKHSGVATFTSFPILKEGVISFESDMNNTCIFTDVLVGSDTVRIYNAHLASIRFQHEDYELVQSTKADPNVSEHDLTGYGRMAKLMQLAYKKRALQLQKVLDHIYDCPHSVVLAGDFNDTPVSYSYAQTRKYLTDSFVESGTGVGNTYVGDLPSFRIDYIFHDDTMESADFRTLPFEFSDHRAIFSKLRVKPE
ncbi:MAG: endonuclease/exonuclease/phosphatase family protein [Flavobacteriales bacterium]